MAMQKGTAEEAIIIVLNAESKICGFCMRAIDDNPVRFGPIGIAKEERNSKLGTVLLKMMCNSMKEQGLERMFFMSTDEAGKRYYIRNGLSVLRVYKDYRKSIKTER